MSCRKAAQRVLAAVSAAGLACAPFPGCVTDPPAIDVEREVGAATRIDDAIVFASTGEPIDVAAPRADHLAAADALHAALRHSPKLAAELARVRGALADAEQARSLPNPILSVAFRLPAGGGAPLVETSLAAELATLLGRGRRAAAADQRLRAAAAGAVTTALDVVAETRTAYATVQALDGSALLVAERVRLLERLLGLARARLAAGEGSRLDVTTLEAEAMALAVDRLEQESRRQVARLRLARLLGAPGGAVEWTLDPFVPPVRLAADAGHLIGAALERRPEIQAQRWELLALGDDLALAQWQWFAGSEGGVEVQRNDSWEIGPALTVPLPLFDSSGPAGRAAQARVIEARHLLVHVSRQVVEEVRIAHAEESAAHAGLARVRDELLPLEQQRREQVEAIYLGGQSDLAPVLLAERELQDAQARLVEFELEAAAASARLERAVGGAAALAEVAAPQESVEAGTGHEEALR